MRARAQYGVYKEMKTFMDENFAQYYSMIQQTQAANNAWSAEQAQKQMDFQERMSNTAHQREVEDLKAAGLNPLLSAGSNGAATTTGAMAQRADQNLDALFGLMNTAFKAQIEEAKAEQVSAAAASRGSGSYVTTSPVNASSSFLESHPVIGAFVDATQDWLYRKYGIKQDTSEKVIKAIDAAVGGIDLTGLPVKISASGQLVFDYDKAEAQYNNVRLGQDTPFAVRTDGTTAVNSAKGAVAKAIASIQKVLNKSEPKAPNAKYALHTYGNGGR